MQFSITGAALLALVGQALAQVPGFDVLTKPSPNEVLEAGTTYKIVWSAAPAEYDESTVSLYVMAGTSHSTLIVDESKPIVSSIVNKLGEYEWAIPASLGGQAAYGIKIALDSNPETFQYSNPFTIKGSESSNSSSSSSADSSTAPTTTAAEESSSTAEPTTLESSITIRPTTGGNSSSTGPLRPSNTRTSAVPSSTSSDVPVVNGGAHAATGAFALLGGLAVAVFAL